MDSRDIQRLDELLQFERAMLEAKIKLAAMQAENQAAMGTTPYREQDFLALLDGIGHNDYSYYMG